jgi:hypothetical protein
MADKTSIEWPDALLRLAQHPVINDRALTRLIAVVATGDVRGVGLPAP